MRTVDLNASRPVLPGGHRRGVADQGGAHRRALVWTAAAGLAAIGLWWWLADEPQVEPGVVVSMPAPASAQREASGSADASVARQRSAVADALDPSRVPEAERTFVADEQGRLRLDQRTRVKVEALVALNHGDDLEAALDELVSGLAPQAATGARNLVQRYQAYAAAQRAAIEPGVAPDSPAAALAQLDTLQRLREQHFGREAAQRLYGEEEASSRKLLEFMRADPDPNAPMAEKAERAQARYDELQRGADAVQASQ